MTPEVSPQQILDEQGYLIFASDRPREIGELLPRLLHWYGEVIPGPLIVTDVATSEEYVRQGLRYYESGDIVPTGHYYKAVAE